MKKLVVVSASVLAGFVFAVALLGVAVLQLQPARAGAPTGRGGTGDVNGDGVVDVSDAVFTLLYLFKGGAEPVACADSPELVGRVAALEAEVESLTTALARSPTFCAERPDRLTDNDDGTVTDDCSGLMWLRSTADVSGDGLLDGSDLRRWSGAMQFVENLQFAGHDDWRLPTVRELEGLIDRRRYEPASASGFDIRTGIVLHYEGGGSSTFEQYWASSGPTCCELFAHGAVFGGLARADTWNKDDFGMILAVRGPANAQ